MSSIEISWWTQTKDCNKDLTKTIKLLRIINFNNIDKFKTSEKNAQTDRFGVYLVTDNDEVLVFGDNSEGWLVVAQRTTIDCKAPVFVYQLCGKKVKDFVCGYKHVKALTSDGKVFSWGFGKWGQVGDETRDDCKKPKLIATLSAVIKVSCGQRHTLALTIDGVVYGWGDNQFGQIGFDPKDSPVLTKPVEIKLQNSATKSCKSCSVVKVDQICCGYRHSLALTEQKTVYSWGRNVCAQLGNGTTIDCYKPRLVCDLHDTHIEKIVCGHSHSLLLARNGHIYAFGYNRYGQMGDGLFEANQVIPKRLNHANKYIDIAASVFDHISIGLDRNRDLLCWGQLSRQQSVCEPIKSGYKLLDQLFAKTLDTSYRTIEMRPTIQKSAHKFSFPITNDFSFPPLDEN